MKPASVFNWTVELTAEKEEGNPHGPHPVVENATADQIKLYPYDKDSSHQTINAKAAYYRHIENDNKQLEKVRSLFNKFGKTNTLNKEDYLILHF